MELPREFLERMRRQLGDGYPQFEESYAKEREYGLRWNPLKMDRPAFEDLMREQGFHLEGVDWAREGYYYPSTEFPGRHPLHEAGIYYIQEPSAMSVAELLDSRPGETVCDLCAAPGGKSTQIAGHMKGEGILLSNEVVTPRAKVLSQNMERMGVVNAVVCNESPKRLAERFAGRFDRILVDAPCSGEGMFRKDERARGEWSLEQVKACAERQKEILKCAIPMLKPDGVFVYSTCTFSREENEDNTRWILKNYPEMELEKEIRILPHLQRGEGHYAARLRMMGPNRHALGQADPLGNGKTVGGKKPKKGKKQRHSMEAMDLKEARRLCLQFAGEVLDEGLYRDFALAFEEGRMVLFGDQVYLLPLGLAPSALDGLKVGRAGLSLGSCKKNRFEPSHALAMAFSSEQVQKRVDIGDPERYFRGETLETLDSDGWMLVTFRGIPLGWGKATHGIVKNHYPKGLRRV